LARVVHWGIVGRRAAVHAYFTSKGPKKSQVAIRHVGLAKKAEIAERKDFWNSRFAALVEVL
jgi:hypothetical protein